MINKENQEKYKVLINKKSKDFLETLDDYKYQKILVKILSLEKEPHPTGCTKLSIKDGYRVKWSKYRILYTINHQKKVIDVYNISHRREIYKMKYI